MVVTLTKARITSTTFLVMRDITVEMIESIVPVFLKIGSKEKADF